jgi:ABC-type nickel/cobalt efflux system permease component RcnA
MGCVRGIGDHFLVVVLIASFVDKEIIANTIIYIQSKQRLFHDTLATELRNVAATHSLEATFGIMLVGFLYGIFHAVGPGHGKVVVTGYLLAGRHTLQRGIVISAVSSLLQAVTAVVLVVGLYQILGLARGATVRVAEWLEIAAYTFMVLVGFALFLRGGREAIDFFRHIEHHTHHEGCGHTIRPDAVQKAQDLRSQILMIVSIGIRPCTGAVLLLVFACMVGAVWAGVLATFAMAIGTFITTASLAVAAVQSKKSLLKLFGASERALAVVHALLGIFGGGFIMLAAGLFLVASLKSPSQELPETDGAVRTPTPQHHPLLQKK